MADKGQSTKLPTDSQKKLQESQAQVDEVSFIILTVLYMYPYEYYLYTYIIILI